MSSCAYVYVSINLFYGATLHSNGVSQKTNEMIHASFVTLEKLASIEYFETPRQLLSTYFSHIDEIST